MEYLEAPLPYSAAVGKDRDQFMAMIQGQSRTMEDSDLEWNNAQHGSEIGHRVESLFISLIEVDSEFEPY